MKLHSIILSSVLALSVNSAYCGDLPEGWTGFQENEGSFEFGVDTSTFHSEPDSYYVESKKVEGSESGVLSRIVHFKEFSGKKFRVTAFLKTEDVQGSAYLFADTNRGNHSMIRGTNDWTKLEVVLELPKDLTRIRYGLSLIGQGKAWIDDIELTVIE